VDVSMPFADGFIIIIPKALSFSLITSVFEQIFILPRSVSGGKGEKVENLEIHRRKRLQNV
jgi:hypothetical protein